MNQLMQTTSLCFPKHNVGVRDQERTKKKKMSARSPDHLHFTKIQDIPSSRPLSGHILTLDLLLVDYGCALQKEILVQGRLYISENHVCFNANIFGWVTNVSSRSFFILSVQSGRGYRLHHHASALSWLKDHSKIVTASFFFSFSRQWLIR